VDHQAGVIDGQALSGQVTRFLEVNVYDRASCLAKGIMESAGRGAGVDCCDSILAGFQRSACEELVVGRSRARLKVT
jgi:hypothetical protein